MRNLDLFGDWSHIFEAIETNSHETMFVWGDSDEFVSAYTIFVVI